jgi:hypothetical protein
MRQGEPEVGNEVLLPFRDMISGAGARLPPRAKTYTGGNRALGQTP